MCQPYSLSYPIAPNPFYYGGEKPSTSLWCMLLILIIFVLLLLLIYLKIDNNIASPVGQIKEVGDKESFCCFSFSLTAFGMQGTYKMSDNIQ